MEIRLKAIKAHLKPLNLPTSLVDEATFIALDCNKQLTKLTKICAAIGLITASATRGIPESARSVCDKLGIRYKNLNKHFSRMKLVSSITSSRKISKLEEMLDKVNAEPDVRTKAYNLMTDKICSTPLRAVGEALKGCHGLDFLAQQDSLLIAKSNKNDLEKYAELRIESFILGRSQEDGTLLGMSLIDTEKRVLDKSLGINYLSNFSSSC